MLEESGGRLWCRSPRNLVPEIGLFTGVAVRSIATPLALEMGKTKIGSPAV